MTPIVLLISIIFKLFINQEEIMKKQILSIVLAGLLTACAMQQGPQTLGDVKGGFEYIFF